MSAVSGIETLRAVGAEAISLQTHISLGNIRKLLAGDFDAFTAIQFNGFVTIIEREYDVDLTEWRTKFVQSNPAPEIPLAVVENDPFANAVKAKKQQRMTVAVLTGLLLLVITVTYLVLGKGSEEEKIELNNTAIEKAKANIASMNARATEGTEAQVEAVQAALRDEENASEMPAQQTAAPQAGEQDAAVSEASAPEVYAVQTNVPETSMPETSTEGEVIIWPKTAIWLGVIDAGTHKRQATTTDEPLRLDASKTWLIVTGHGYLTLECGETNTSYSKVGQLLFLYEDGACRELDEAEFRERNRGSLW